MLREILAAGIVMMGSASVMAQQPITIESMPPVVVKTIPQSGDTQVDPQLKELSATFSKDMQDGNWSWVQASPPENYPEITGRPHFAEDKRTCVVPVSLQPDQVYVVWLNRAQFSSFMDVQHNRALPYLLVFKTRAPATTRTAETKE